MQGSSLTAAPGGGAAGGLFERILVPVDFTPWSRRALATAMAIAERNGSEVVLFNATRFGESDEFLAGVGAAWPQGDIITAAKLRLDRLASDVASEMGIAKPARVVCEADLADDVPESVARAVRRYAATLVILATEGTYRPGLLRTSVERIAKRVAGEASVLELHTELTEPDVPRD